MSLKTKWLKNYLTWNPKSEYVFGSVLSPQKVFRESDIVMNARAYDDILKYYKDNAIKAYAVHFFFRNLVATMIRDFANNGDWFKSFNIDLMIPNVDINLK